MEEKQELQALKERIDRFERLNKGLVESHNILLLETVRLQQERDDARSKLNALEANVEIWKGREWLAMVPKMMELVKQIKEMKK